MIFSLKMKDFSNVYFVAICKAADADIFVASTWACVSMIP